jgi:hypothetical protein
MACRHGCNTHLDFNIKEQRQRLEHDHTLYSRDHTVNSRAVTRFAKQGARNLSGENYAHHNYYSLKHVFPPKGSYAEGFVPAWAAIGL